MDLDDQEALDEVSGMLWASLPHRLRSLPWMEHALWLRVPRVPVLEGMKIPVTLLRHFLMPMECRECLGAGGGEEGASAPLHPSPLQVPVAPGGKSNTDPERALPAWVTRAPKAGAALFMGIIVWDLSFPSRPLSSPSALLSSPVHWRLTLIVSCPSGFLWVWPVGIPGDETGRWAGVISWPLEDHEEGLDYIVCVMVNGARIPGQGARGLCTHGSHHPPAALAGSSGGLMLPHSGSSIAAPPQGEWKPEREKWN